MGPSVNGHRNWAIGLSRDTQTVNRNSCPVPVSGTLCAALVSRKTIRDRRSRVVCAKINGWRACPGHESSGGSSLRCRRRSWLPRFCSCGSPTRATGSPLSVLPVPASSASAFSERSAANDAEQVATNPRTTSSRSADPDARKPDGQRDKSGATRPDHQRS